MDLGTEERRVAMLAIATLVNIKDRMRDLILIPAGVPAHIYDPIFKQRDPITKESPTKWQMAPLILDALEKQPDGTKIVRAIIKIAIHWPNERYYLAKDEHKARATVQQARALSGSIQLIEDQESREQEQRNGELAHIECEQEKGRLFEIFKDLWDAKNAQYRGYQLEILLKRAFELYNIPMREPFRRNQGSEQIDGAFKLDSWYYLVECKWQTKQADSSQLDALLAKIGRSNKQTMGLFLSINGWTEGVITTLKQNPDKCIILMNGQDLYYLLSKPQIELRDFLLAKNDALTLKCEPFLGIVQYIQQQ